MEGVRLVHMERDELAEVDVHPLVRADMDVTMLLAELFMAKSGVDRPLCEPSTPCTCAAPRMLCFDDASSMPSQLTQYHSMTQVLCPANSHSISEHCQKVRPRCVCIHTCSPCSVKGAAPVAAHMLILAC